MDKKNISRLLRTGYDPDAMMIAKEFEPLDFEDGPRKKFNILWDKQLTKSKYGQHKLANGSARARGHNKAKDKSKYNRTYGKKIGTGAVIRPVFQYTRKTPDGHDEQ